MHVLRNLFLFLGISTLPVYYFPSGLPQASHIFLCVFFLFSIADGKIVLQQEEKLLAALFALSAIRETIAVLGGATSIVLSYPVFIFYNIFVLVFIRKYLLHAHQYERYIFISGLCVAGLIASLSIFTSGFSIFGEVQLTRITGTFNNPNQLAYFSVCLGSIVLTLFLARQMNIFIATILLGACFVMVVSALSKAGLISFALILFTFCISVAKRMHIAASISVVFALPIICIYVYTLGIFEQTHAFQRLYNIGIDYDDSFHQRGYLMFQHYGSAFEVFFGLGSDKVQKILGHEVHSTIIYNLVNYSIFGLIFYTSFIVAWARKLTTGFGFFPMLGIVGAPMLYGLAHNGTRFTLFYVLIACGLSFANELSNSAKISYVSGSG